MKAFKNILLFFSISFMLASCTAYDDVEVLSVKDIEVIEFSQDAIQAYVDLELENPNWYNVKIIDSELELFLNDKPMGKVTLGEKVKIPRKSTTVQRVHILSDLEDLETNFLQNVLTLLFNKTTKLEVKGWIEGKGFVVRKKVPIEVVEEINPRDFGM